jgi:hypothetical protein
MEINLNLIPPYREKEIQKNKRFRLILRIELVMLMFVLIFFSFLFSLNYILDLNFILASNDTEISKDREQYDNIRKYDREFNEVNINVAQIEKIDKDQLYWSRLFLKLSQSVIAGISIQSVATKDYSVFLIGKAESRENLISFRDSLAKDSCFSSINLPLSDLVSRGNVDFQMDLAINEDCIRPVK